MLSERLRDNVKKYNEHRKNCVELIYEDVQKEVVRQIEQRSFAGCQSCKVSIRDLFLHQSELTIKFRNLLSPTDPTLFLLPTEILFIVNKLQKYLSTEGVSCSHVPRTDTGCFDVLW